MLKIGWILLADKTWGSSRIHGINIHNYLKKNGWQSEIIVSPSQYNITLDLTRKELCDIMKKNFDIILFQKVSQLDAEVLNYFQLKRKKKTCFIICDLEDYSLYSQVSAVITTSHFLKDRLKTKVKKDLFVIEDALETGYNLYRKNYKQKDNKISIIWLGRGDTLHLLKPIEAIIGTKEFEDFQLITLSNHEGATYQWNNNNIEKNWEIIVKYDIAIIPSNNTDWYRSKSNNKLTTFMSLGLPVIAYPIPAYKNIIINNENGFLASNDQEWKYALNYLRSAENRKKIGTVARKYALQNYSIKIIGKQWEKILKKISATNCRFVPNVDVRTKIKYYFYQIYCLLYKLQIINFLIFIKRKTAVRSRCVSYCKSLKKLSIEKYHLFKEWIASWFYFLKHPKRHKFHIVTSFYNCEKWIEKCLDSVYSQKYQNNLYTHIVINDCSNDQSDEIIKQWTEKHPDNKVKYFFNEKNKGLCANNTKGFRMASSSDIVIELNGDDWLPDKKVLSFLNRIYCNSEIWNTYNSSVLPDGKRLNWTGKIDNHITKNNRFRQSSWVSTHLHSFRAKLFSYVKENDLIDPQTNKYWTAAVDRSHYYPILELAGKHSRHIYRKTYVYNLNENSLQKIKLDYQKQCETKIRNMPNYRPLKKLEQS